MHWQAKTISCEPEILNLHSQSFHNFLTRYSITSLLFEKKAVHDFIQQPGLWFDLSCKKSHEIFSSGLNECFLIFSWPCISKLSCALQCTMCTQCAHGNSGTLVAVSREVCTNSFWSLDKCAHIVLGLLKSVHYFFDVNNQCLHTFFTESSFFAWLLKCAHWHFFCTCALLADRSHHCLVAPPQPCCGWE